MSVADEVDRPAGGADEVAGARDGGDATPTTGAVTDPSPAESPSPGEIRSPAESPSPGEIRSPAEVPSPGDDRSPAGNGSREDDRSPAETRSPADNRWLAETGGTRGPEYAARFAALADEGADVHGEARFLDALLAPASDVVDAGCGTGRVAIELARRGHRTHGIDVDASMLDVARSAAPHLRWTLGDLLGVEPGSASDESDGLVDLVVAAGNVMVYLTPGTEADVVRRLARWLRPGGLLVVGFAADRHVSPADHDRWCATAGLEPVAAHTAWDPDSPPPDGDGDYAVLVHRRPHRTG